MPDHDLTPGVRNRPFVDTYRQASGTLAGGGRPGLVQPCDDGVVHVELMYFDGCPSWQTADERLRRVLDGTGHDGAAIHYRKVETFEEAELVGFTGSPTVLLDGLDPFAQPGAMVALVCRMYVTPDGLGGSPTVEQLMDVIR